MGTLSGLEIARMVEEGRIQIKPFTMEQLNPNSYDLRLAPLVRFYDLPSGEVLDIKKKNKTDTLLIPNEGLVLQPGVLYLGSTVETVGSDHFVTFIEGKSSMGRLGFTAHVTAGFVDCGFHGNLTMEMTVVEPLRIYADIRICQICFNEVVGPVDLYRGKYQNQVGPTPSQAWKDF